MKKPNRLVSSFSSRTQTAATWISDASLKTPRTYEATSHTPEGATWKGNTGGLPWSSSSAAAAAAKSFQSCLTLCDPIDSSPPGSSVPGILQARTLEWGAIFFSNVCKWKVKVKLLSRVRLLETPWTSAFQAPPSMGFSRQEDWSGMSLQSETSQKEEEKYCMLMHKYGI